MTDVPDIIPTRAEHEQVMARPADESRFWDDQRSRWFDRPVDPPQPDRRWPAWKIVATYVGVAVAIICTIAIARSVQSAERAPAWDVFAFREGRLYQADGKNIVPVQSSGPFPSKRLCEDVGIQTVRIREAGWKLSCRRVDQ